MLFIKTSECRQVENKRNEVIPGKPPLEEGRGGEEARPGRRHPLGDPPVSGPSPERRPLSLPHLHVPHRRGGGEGPVPVYGSHGKSENRSS